MCFSVCTEMSNLPLWMLQKAIKLRNHHKTVFIALYSNGPSTATQIAELVGHERAYVHMRLRDLTDRGLVKASREGKKVIFEVIKDDTAINV